jgi:DNA-binding beta-propeller fold protein YncE
MSIVDNFSGIFTQPHGLAATRNFDTLYITSQYGNVIYRYVLNSFDLEPITINEGPETFSSATGTPDPHEILMTPDYSKMFITCQNNKEVKVMNMATEQIIATIPVGAVPKEIAISKKRGLAFITCMEDPENLYSGKSRGSVYVIDINTLQKVGNPIYGDFYQPHGIVVDEQNDLIYIASTNTNPDGPAPHHSSSCNGRNGWYSIYDLNTLQPFNNIRYETTPDPYGADVRFK